MMKNIVEGTMLVIAVVGVIGGVWNRLKTNKGIGIRFIQYLGLTVLVPIITILSLEGRISQEMTGAVAATAVGAVLAGIGKDDGSHTATGKSQSSLKGDEKPQEPTQA